MYAWSCKYSAGGGQHLFGRCSMLISTLRLSKDQPEDGPTNTAKTCCWNYNVIEFNKMQCCV